MRRYFKVAVVSLLPLALVTGGKAEARIIKIQINSRAVAYGGAKFGSVGQYETLRGVAFGEIDPDDPLNEVITDIKLAPRNARGMVEYNMDFWLSKPVDMTRANGTLLHDVPNRGRVRSLELNVGGSGDSNAGDGLLQRQGFVLSDNGWQGDVATGLQIRLPVARNKNGTEIVNRIRAEYILDAPVSTVDVTTPPAYEAASTSNAGATLTRRVHQDDPRELIPNGDWAFAACSTTPFPGVPSTKKVCLKGLDPKGGFDTNHIYELLYDAKNPTVLGVGFAATRDFVSFLRNSNGASTGHCGRRDRDEARRGGDDDDDDGNARKHASCPIAGPMPENPLGNSIQNAIIYGSSQSGRWIRTFIQLGFNQDENRNLAVEGAIPHKASNRGAFNVRFGQPDRLSGTQHTERQFPGAESSQTWGVSHDRISGVTAGQLDRCRRTHSCPKIFHTNTDTEYWQALMALNTTDSEGKRDLAIPKNVRIYLYAATRHGGGDVTKQPTDFPKPPANCQLRNNNNPFIHGQRALLVALREWILDGTEPPPSLYPRLAAGTLVPLSAIHYPYLPAVNFTLSGVTTEKFFLDRGPKFNVEDISGVMVEPPIKRGAYSVRVPRVDADGNTIAGLPSTMVLVPVGTHLGWNVRKAGFSEGDSCDLNGAVIPFFRTFAERQAANDPRPSLQERYPMHDDYVAKVTAAANGLFGARLLLREDADSLITQANATPVP